jgi:uncharacterized membrane protein YjgN (DUF898 family)
LPKAISTTPKKQACCLFEWFQWRWIIFSIFANKEKRKAERFSSALRLSINLKIYVVLLFVALFSIAVVAAFAIVATAASAVVAFSAAPKAVYKQRQSSYDEDYC